MEIKNVHIQEFEAENNCVDLDMHTTTFHKVFISLDFRGIDKHTYKEK